MKSTKKAVLLITILLLTLFAMSFAGPKWRIHDLNRPNPVIINPGTSSTQDKPGLPPSDAIVLFDGKDLSQWRSMDGSAAKWIVKEGRMECVRGSGYIRTARNFGDCQLHVEFATPTPPEGSSQGRGNSGVFLMGIYEVQVLDNYDNVTYADGQCSALYGQYPPQVNACRKPGEWQSYDIIFHAPVFNVNKELVKPAIITVFQNGVLTQDHVELMGPTNWLRRDAYTYHAEKLPLSLQDHGNPVLYRNIWVRELPAPGPGEKAPRATYTLSPETLKSYTGSYSMGGPNAFLKVKLENDELLAAVSSDDFNPIYAETDTKFFSQKINLEFEFIVSNGKVTGADIWVAGGKMSVKKME
ncbi:MAG TPA: DUF1080 domain-containing protein [bacterium]|nr:DUF1080 domain-containing protein [bacterium]HPN42104.1 DUF1080 domain-containing protein [bacterium]